MTQQETGRKRVVIENVRPEIDGGRHPVKRVLGEQVTVKADVFTDGHDSLACVLLFGHTAAELLEPDDAGGI